MASFGCGGMITSDSGRIEFCRVQTKQQVPRFAADGN